jgi:hypothetical protein
MKTIKFFSVLILALIFAGVNTVYPGSGLTSSANNLNKTTIKYEVNINLLSGTFLCNTYLVQVTDEKGIPVAHAQIFVPGKSKYVFNEVATKPGKERIASLVLPYTYAPYVCPIGLITKPDVKMGPFYPGKTYYFNLYPQIVKEVINGDDSETMVEGNEGSK